MVTGTVISSTAFNALTADLATGLSTCILKDGTQVLTGNIPMGSFKLTGLAAGSAAGNSVRWEQTAPGVLTATGDILYASSANTPARLAIGTSRQQLATNSGATAPEWVASLQSLMTGTGDIVQSSGANTPARLAIGTARQVPTVNVGATALAYANPITLGTEQASTSGTSIDFTGIPAGVRRIIIMWVNVSTNGSAGIRIQIGDAGGFETTGYLGSAGQGVTFVNFTDSFGVLNSSADAARLHGSIILTLENSSAFTWTSMSNISASNAAVVYVGSGSKSLTAELTQVRITADGIDTFDNGVMNITYE